MRPIILLITILLFGGALRAQPLAAEEQYKTALEKGRSGKHFLALHHIDQAISMAPDSPRYQAAKGYLLMAAQRPKEARAQLDTTIKRYPSHPDAYLYRAGIQIILQNPKAAMPDFDQALKLATMDTTRYLAYLYRGAARYSLREFNGAKEDYLAALKIDSIRNPDLYTGLASVYNQLKDYDKSVAYNLRAHRMQPENPSPLENLGFVYSENGNYTLAKAYLDSALALNPNSPLALNNMGYVKIKTGDPKGALPLIDRSISLYPENSYAYRNKALAYIALKNIPAACKNLKTAKAKGFANLYGQQVNQLLAKHCK